MYGSRVLHTLYNHDAFTNQKLFLYYGNVCGSTIQEYYASYWSIPIPNQFGIHIMMKIKKITELEISKLQQNEIKYSGIKHQEND